MLYGTQAVLLVLFADAVSELSQQVVSCWFLLP